MKTNIEYTETSAILIEAVQKANNILNNDLFLMSQMLAVRLSAI